MITRAAIVAEARTWLDTPFKHQGRVKGRACDCVGVVVGTAQALGLMVEDEKGYSITPSGTLLMDVVGRQGVRVPVTEALPGDVYVMRFEREPQHLAFATDVGVLHAYSAVGRCVEHAIDDKWRRRILAVYRFKELAHE